MNELEKAVNDLVAKAANSEESTEAMRYSQAAVNAANAALTIRTAMARDEK